MSKCLLLPATVLVLSVVAIAGEEAPTAANARTFRVMQFNVWQEGTSVPDGNYKIAAAILAANADIVAFSEVRNYKGADWHTKIIAALKSQAPSIVFHGKFAGGDVGLISRFPIVSTESVFDETKGDSGSVMAWRLDMHGRPITVCSAHLDYKHYSLNWVRGYNGGDPDWKMIDPKGTGEPARRTDASAILEYNRKSKRDAAIKAIIDFAARERAAGRAVLLAGDFNEASHLDWTAKAAAAVPSRYGVAISWENSQALANAGLLDAYRSVYPDEVRNPGYTWPATVDGKKTTSWAPKSDERDRIDFIHFASNQGLHPAKAWLVGPRTCFIGEKKVDDATEDAYVGDTLAWPSDHRAVLIEFKY